MVISRMFAADWRRRPAWRAAAAFGLHVQTVNPCRIVVVKFRLLIGGIIRSQPFERIPQDVIAAAQFIDREIGFKQAPIHTEMFDCVLEIRSGRFEQFLRSWAVSVDVSQPNPL